MSDPISLIATIALNATSAVEQAELPTEISDQAAVVVRGGGDAATALFVQLDAAVTQLPYPAQQLAQQAISDATEQVAALVPPSPVTFHEPPLSDPAVPAELGLPEAAPTYTPLAPPQLSIDTPTAATPQSYSAAPATFIPVAAASAVTTATTPDIAVFIPWLRKAGDLCEGVSAPTLAALYAAENGFRHGPSAPVSPAGALGPGQFMPETWRSYGHDADGDGATDVLGVADPVMASGRLLCDTFHQIDEWKRAGLVSGDTLDLTLAAYNAGGGAVLRSGGMPSGAMDYEVQTKPYVARIRATESQFRWLLPSRAESALGGTGEKIVDAAMSFLGIPYVWGGGGVGGPTNGGFDCSGLTVFAVHLATQGAITLPRTSQTQWATGQDIVLADAVPGDLLFGNWGPSGPGHVGIYIGGGQMIHAPTTGDVVRISSVPGEMLARRVI